MRLLRNWWPDSGLRHLPVTTIRRPTGSARSSEEAAPPEEMARRDPTKRHAHRLILADTAAVDHRCIARRCRRRVRADVSRRRLRRFHRVLRLAALWRRHRRWRALVAIR